jgi:hypothetical protein
VARVQFTKSCDVVYLGLLIISIMILFILSTKHPLIHLMNREMPFELLLCQTPVQFQYEFERNHMVFSLQYTVWQVFRPA